MNFRLNQKQSLLFADSTMSISICSPLIPRKKSFLLGCLAFIMLLSRSSSAQNLPLGTGINALDPRVDSPTYQMQESIHCPTTSIGFGVFAGNGNQWGNNNFAPYNSNNAGGTNAGGIAGIRIPLGGPLAEYCRKQAELQLRRSEGNMLIQIRNNALQFLAQCDWMEQYYPGFRWKQTNTSSNASRTREPAFELFQKCPDKRTRIAGSIQAEENKDPSDKKKQPVKKPQDSSGRQSRDDEARKPPLGIMAPINTPQQVQLNP
jgi:hypothetical protein